MEIHSRIPGTQIVLDLVGIYEGSDKTGGFIPKPHYRMGPSRPLGKHETHVRHVDPEQARDVALSTGRLGLGLGTGN